MKFKQYSNLSSRTAQSFLETIKLRGVTMERLNYILGMIGEYASEVFTEETMQNKNKFIDEFGDFMWYFSNYCRVLNHIPSIPNKEVDLHTLTLLGQLAELEKKIIFHQKKVDNDEIKIILNKLYANAIATCASFDVNIGEVFEFNVEKLKKRFPEGFDAERANNKDEVND